MSILFTIGIRRVRSLLRRSRDLFYPRLFNPCRPFLFNKNQLLKKRVRHYRYTYLSSLSALSLSLPVEKAPLFWRSCERTKATYAKLFIRTVPCLAKLSRYTLRIYKNGTRKKLVWTSKKCLKQKKEMGLKLPLFCLLDETKKRNTNTATV